MNAKICLAVLLLTTALAAAAEPQTRVLVLDNENLLEGEITRAETGYQVRRPDGGNLTIPSARVLAVVSTKQAAFQIVSERANRRDADERLRLARWCQSNDLRAEALAEAKAAAKLRPGFTAAERLVISLEELAKLPAPKVDPAVVQAKGETVAPAKVEDVPAIEYNSESYPLFATKVNTILNNACAHCHARDDMKGFRLTKAGGRNAITKNLMSSLSMLTPKDPAASPLLVKSVTPHGGASEAPFKSKGHPAYATLETWARFARSTEGTQAPEAPLPMSEPKKLPELAPMETGVKPMPKTESAFGQESKTDPEKAPKANGNDPFDPAIFNRKSSPK